MRTAGDASEQNWPIIQADLEDFKFLCSIKHRTEDAWRLYSLHYEVLISALNGGGRLASRPRRFTPGERAPQHPLDGGFGGSPKQVWA